MTLIKSISGVRGTIGGKPSINLTPVDIIEMVSAYGQWLINQGNTKKVVVGRDGRISGPAVSTLAIQTLVMMGIDVIDLGLSTTPTVEMGVTYENAGGGIIFTASHNPKEWNALKFLNEKGEFISAVDGQSILEIANDRSFIYANVDQLGTVVENDSFIDRHIQDILALDLVNVELVKSRKFKVVVDCINSTGAISVIPLLQKLGCNVISINDQVDGKFAHNPEPLAKHLSQLSEAVVKGRADLGIAIDPDVDRLAFMNEDGQLFGEEYTLVALADYILKHNGGPTVSNLSSTRALGDITQQNGYQYYASAVGEVNVVVKMKDVGAVIGGEGNGGVIFPELHYGRDALVGIALFLSYFAEKKTTMSSLKKTFPAYEMVKDKIALTPNIDVDRLLKDIQSKVKHGTINHIDGVKVDFDRGWVHLRKSNTEPIIRVYSEAPTKAEAEELISDFKELISSLLPVTT